MLNLETVLVVESNLHFKNDAENSVFFNKKEKKCGVFVNHVVNSAVRVCGFVLDDCPLVAEEQQHSLKIATLHGSVQ